MSLSWVTSKWTADLEPRWGEEGRPAVRFRPRVEARLDTPHGPALVTLSTFHQSQGQWVWSIAWSDEEEAARAHRPFSIRGSALRMAGHMVVWSFKGRRPTIRMDDGREAGWGVARDGWLHASESGDSLDLKLLREVQHAWAQSLTSWDANHDSDDEWRARLDQAYAEGRQDGYNAREQYGNGGSYCWSTEGLIYLMIVGPWLKIGWTGRPTAEARRAEIETNYGLDATFLTAIDGTPRDERALHNRFDHLRVRRRVGGRLRRELFEYSSEIAAAFGVDLPDEEAA